MSDDKTMDLDLGIDPAEAQDAVGKGLVAGAKKGLQKGAQDALIPVAQRAAEEAVKNIASGGTGTGAIQAAIRNIADMAQTTAMQKMVEAMGAQKAAPPPGAAEAPPKSPLERFKEMAAQATAMGLDIKDIFPDKRSLWVAMTNPDMLPMLMMSGGEREQKGSAADLLPMLLMNMNKQPAPVPNPDNTNNIMATLLQSIIQAQQQQAQAQQQFYQQILEMQRQHAAELMEAKLKAMEPYMQRTTFADEVAALQEKLAKLQEVGLIGSGGDKSPREAELDFESKRMALELKRDELKLQRELEMEKQRAEMQERQLEQIGKLVGFGQKLFKALPIAPPPAAAPADPPAPAPSPAPARAASQLGARITEVLKKVQTAMPEADDED